MPWLDLRSVIIYLLFSLTLITQIAFGEDTRLDSDEIDWLGRSAFSPSKSGNEITDLLTRIDEEIKRNPKSRPVVVVDLDDTVYDNRYPGKDALKEWLNTDHSVSPETKESVRKYFQKNPDGLPGAQPVEIFKGIGLSNSTELKHFSDFFWQKILSPEYISRDYPLLPGAKTRLDVLAQHGARIVYSTGRQEKLLGSATRAAIRASKLPIGQDDDVVGKPEADKALLAPETKRMTLEKLKQNSKVLAVIDNSPEALLALKKTAGSDTTLILITSKLGRIPDASTAVLHVMKSWSGAPSPFVRHYRAAFEPDLSHRAPTIGTPFSKSPNDIVKVVALDEAGTLKLEMRIHTGPEGSFLRLRNFGTHEVAREGIAPSRTISNGITVMVDGKRYAFKYREHVPWGLSTEDIAIPEIGGHKVKLQFYGKNLGSYTVSSAGVTALTSPKTISRFDVKAIGSDVFSNDSGSSTKAFKKNSNLIQEGPSQYASRVDLHTHLTGALKTEDLIAIAEKHQVLYPTAQLKKIMIKWNPAAVISKDGRDYVPFSPENISYQTEYEKGVHHIKAAMGLSTEFSEPHSYLSQAYRARGPILNDVRTFPDVLEAVAKDFAKNGVKYAELSFYSIVKPEFLSVAEQVVPALEKKYGVKLRFLVGSNRSQSASVLNNDIDKTLQAMRKSSLVVGIDYMGEEKNSVRDIKPFIERAAQLKTEFPHLVLRVHAGENPRFPENVAESIRYGATRIGHGIYGVTPEALELAKKNGVTIEFNLNSNLALQNVKSTQMLRKAAEQYTSAGVNTTFGTDGHGIYETTPKSEEAVARAIGFTTEDLKRTQVSDAAYVSQMDIDFAKRNKAHEAQVNPEESHFPTAKAADDAANLPNATVALSGKMAADQRAEFKDAPVSPDQALNSKLEHATKQPRETACMVRSLEALSAAKNRGATENTHEAREAKPAEAVKFISKPIVNKATFVDALIDGNRKVPQMSMATSTDMVGKILQTFASKPVKMTELMAEPTARDIEMIVEPMERAHKAFGVAMDGIPFVPDLIRYYQNLSVYRVAKAIDTLEPDAPILGHGFVDKWVKRGPDRRYSHVVLDEKTVAKRIDDYLASARSQTSKAVLSRIGSVLEREIQSCPVLRNSFSDLRKAYKSPDTADIETALQATKAAIPKDIQEKLSQEVGDEMAKRLSVSLFN